MIRQDFQSIVSYLEENVCASARDLSLRQTLISRYLERDSVVVAGFGSKGRSMADYLANVKGKTIFVFDASASAREAAQQRGFGVFDDVGKVRDSGLGVVLAACQHQLEQSILFPGIHIFFEEAAYFFDMPYHFNRTRDFPNWIVENTSKLAEVYLELAADERWNFVENILFRASLNPRNLRMHRNPVRGMWFDVPREFGRRKYRSILDVGAFDGDTLRGAREQLQCEVAVAIEANPTFSDKILGFKGVYRDVQLLPVAAWSHDCHLDFTVDASGMFSVAESESGPIRAIALDGRVREKIDLLKMDIEGSELTALQGAKNLLSSGPDVAIAAYHRPEDIVSIFGFIKHKKSYDCYIRHYSDCLDDTIFYFLVNGE